MNYVALTMNNVEFHMNHIGFVLDLTWIMLCACVEAQGCSPTAHFPQPNATIDFNMSYVAFNLDYVEFNMNHAEF